MVTTVNPNISNDTNINSDAVALSDADLDETSNPPDPVISPAAYNENFTTTLNPGNSSGSQSYNVSSASVNPAATQSNIQEQLAPDDSQLLASNTGANVTVAAKPAASASASASLTPAMESAINKAVAAHPGASKADLIKFTQTTSFKTTPPNYVPAALDRMAVLSAATNGHVSAASGVRLTATARDVLQNTKDGILAGHVRLQINGSLGAGVGAQYQRINGVPTLQVPPKANDQAALYGLAHEYQHAVSDNRFSGNRGGGIGSFLEEYRAVYVDRSMTFGDSPVAFGKDMASQTDWRFRQGAGGVYKDIKGAYDNVPAFKAIVDKAVTKMQSGAAVSPETLRKELLQAYNADKTGVWKQYVNPAFLQSPSSLKNVW
jgi:hypothetical protein